jgi:hypothetical protein
VRLISFAHVSVFASLFLFFLFFSLFFLVRTSPSLLPFSYPILAFSSISSCLVVDFLRLSF